jgi:hypothetical protein
MLELRLTGPEGNNPLGFLTALGVMLTLEDAGYQARLGWNGITPLISASVSGFAECETEEERQALYIEALYRKLRREPGHRAAEAEQARKEMERAKTTVKKKQDEIKARKLNRDAAREARHLEVEPLQEIVRRKETAFKRTLVESAADPSVTLGKNLTETNDELIKHAATACERSRPTDRRWVDLTAAYGVADPTHPEERMFASPWALVSGSGHQDFLSSIEELMIQCTGTHLRHALFEVWRPMDEKYSLRLDMGDDRRYALMDRDPAGGDNKPYTLWGANRLAFEALRFFPAMPLRGGMGVRAWRAMNRNWQENCRVRWPLWRPPIGSAAIRSLLGLRDLWLDDSASREKLTGIGVYAVMESRRIAVGNAPNQKFNLTPATPMWISSFRPKSRGVEQHGQA